MTALPHPITEPLHIDEPFPTGAVLLGVLALWLLYRFVRHLRRRWAASPRPPALAPPKAVADNSIASRIATIRRQALDREAYRAGCHELAATLKRHFAQILPPGPALERMTAAEMARRLGDRSLTRYFSLLSGLQFSRQTPSRSDFDGACDLALEVVVNSGVTAKARRDTQ